MTTEYYQNMNRESKERYLEKISLINGIDPYSLSKNDMSVDVQNFPHVLFMDIVSYLVDGKSAYTKESFKAYKSLEAYNQFVCGWVSDVATLKVNGLSLVLGKVRHSQRLSEKPLEPWFISSNDGIIKCAHCTCMAGLGESCTHVAALLFCVQDIILRREDVSCTSVPAYWNKTSKKTVEYLPIKDIDFSTPQSKTDLPSASGAPQRAIPRKTDEEFHSILRQLQDVGCFSAVMNVVSPFNCSAAKSNLNLKHLFNEQYLNVSLQDLQKTASDFEFTFTTEDTREIEISTRNQSKSSEWFIYRSGRVTASNMKSVCTTKITSPALSTIKKICYPMKTPFTNKAIAWGCSHEKDAKVEFQTIQSSKHTNFKLANCGLIISCDKPFIGASPDGLVSCSCCGLGCIEIKCPYCLRDSQVDETLKHACLENTDHGLQLSKKHSYYYQIQTQIFVTQRQYCDFVLWTKNGIHMERILPDNDFWLVVSERAETFFKKVLLPELYGKAFTEPNFEDGSSRDVKCQSPPKKRPHLVFL